MTRLLIAGVFIVLGSILYAFKVVFDELREIRDRVWELENSGLERKVNAHRELMKELAKQLDKKILWNVWFDYKIVDLTESEKTANKLRKQADKLEREDQ